VSRFERDTGAAGKPWRAEDAGHVERRKSEEKLTSNIHEVEKPRKGTLDWKGLEAWVRSKCQELKKHCQIMRRRGRAETGSVFDNAKNRTSSEGDNRERVEKLSGDN